MNNIPLLQKALAEDWNKLPLVIRRNYSIPRNSNTRLKGRMKIVFPSFLLPLVSLIHLFGGLVSRRGKDIETVVEKTSSPHNTKLFRQRTLSYPNNKKDYFYSQMVYLQNHELIETVHFGFGLRLIVAVENGRLVIEVTAISGNVVVFG